ncbi:MAG TPA: phosphoadenylyl-sulfate reductase [Chitinophagaceae bacterium]|nr:phosphoadenylyl-sulfate reductase [Chitinophagaceae bacterium]
MAHSLQTYIGELTTRTNNLEFEAALQLVADTFPGQVTFSSSFSFEDQAITHAIAQNRLPVSIFTLDTGRLFPETYSVWSSTNARYQTPIKAYYPDYTLLEKFITETGPNSFYESVENRKMCCHIRKVEPLKRALQGNVIWITGLRAGHSAARQDLEQFEWDESNQIIKYHPLLHWTTEAVREYINRHHIPYNALHDKGFVSIGCAPCTRAIKPGEDFRAGRWWWEDSSKKECGLHVHEQRMVVKS